MTKSKQLKARMELERRRAAVIQASRRAEAELDGLRSAERGHEFEEAAQAEQGAADLERLNEAERLELRRIEAALARIDEGRWGECAECGRAIEARRLEALPWAIRCAGCAESKDRATRNGAA